MRDTFERHGGLDQRDHHAADRSGRPPRLSRGERDSRGLDDQLPAGQTRANNAIVPLGVLGDIAIRCDQISGTVHLIIDTDGYLQ